MLTSDLYNYSDACIVTKGIIDHLAAVANKNDKAEKNVTLKNNAPFRTCISKILMLIMLMIMLQMVNHLNIKQKTSRSRCRWKSTTTTTSAALNAEVIVPHKYLINCWRSPNLPLINCSKIELVYHGQMIVY